MNFRSRPLAPLAAALALAGAACLPGCSSSGAPQTTVDSRPQGGDYRLVQLDPGFGESVAVANVARRRVDGFLQVQVSLLSRATKTLALETKWEWYDRDGFRIEDGREVWSPSELAAGASVEVKGIGPKAEADSFRFHVRAANPILDSR